MNTPQVHLMLNHIPVLGILFVAVTLTAGLWQRHNTLLRFALGTLIAISLAVIPVYFSGAQSEETIEKLAGVQKTAIELHEDVARVVSLGLGVLGLVSLFTLIRYRSRVIPPALAATMLIAALALSGAMAWTAHLGGQIRHSELLDTMSTATTPTESHQETENK